MNEIGHKATKSIITLTSKTLFLNILNFIGAFFLTIFLSPSDFGVFIITSTMVDILAYFSDIGLAGALIQKRSKLKDEEIHTTFTIQMGLVITGVIIASFFGKIFQGAYKLDQNGLYLFYALLIGFVFSSLKTIPSVLSERKLKFENVIIPQIVETIVYNLIIVILAWRGFGIRSYIWAVLVRAVLGTITIYYLVRWKPKLSFHFKSIKKLLTFGIPYQVNGLIAVFKDRISLLILGGILGTEALGILGWAEKWSNLPLRYFLDSTVKVAFPLFSRVQNDLTKAKDSLEKSIYFIATLIFPTLAGGYLLIPTIIEIIPRYSKWEPGLKTFNLFLIAAAIASISTFMTNFLTAVGKVRQVMGLMIMWTILTLILYPWFASLWSYEGVAIASIMIGLSSIFTYILTRKIIKFSLLKQVLPALISSIIMILTVLSIERLLGTGIVKMIGIILSGGIIYLGSLLLLDRKNLINQIKTFLAYAKNK